MIYRYDGTFPGFLCAVYEACQDGTSHTEGICTAMAPGGLFSSEKEVRTTSDRAERVAQAFLADCGRQAFRQLFRAFLAEEPGREDVLFRYIRNGFRLKKALYAHHMEAWAWTVWQWAGKTGAEAEKLLGLVRFSELSDRLLFAEISPTHDVLPLMAGHFQRRLAGESWAIYDARRHRAVYWDRKELLLAEVPERLQTLSYSGEETAMRRLWQTYYDHIAVQERTNPILRRSYMPQKYWRYLTEMNWD